MVGDVHLSNREQHISVTSASCNRRYAVYFIALYFFVVTVVLASAGLVLPKMMLQSEEVAAGPGSVYIPGMSSKETFLLQFLHMYLIHFAFLLRD